MAETGRSGERAIDWHARVAEAQDSALQETDRVLKEVKAERARQFAKWGWGRKDGHGDEDMAALAHDDAHTAGDWTRFIVRKLGQAEQAIEDGEWWKWRSAMLSVAALAVAAIEAYDRRQAR